MVRLHQIEPYQIQTDLNKKTPGLIAIIFTIHGKISSFLVANRIISTSVHTDHQIFREFKNFSIIIILHQ